MAQVPQYLLTKWLIKWFNFTFINFPCNFSRLIGPLCTPPLVSEGQCDFRRKLTLRLLCCRCSFSHTRCAAAAAAARSMCAGAGAKASCLCAVAPARCSAAQHFCASCLRCQPILYISICVLCAMRLCVAYSNFARE